MNISPADLLAQAQRALTAWPFIVDTERKYGLAPFTLFAVGSRETNLTDEVGDGGHGHSVWQLDDRSHVIPNPFPVTQAADIAGSMVVGLIAYFHGNEDLAFDAYNEGVSGAARWGDAGTTGHDYGPDVIGRRAWLQAHVPYPEADMLDDADRQWISQQITASQKVITGDTESRYNDLVNGGAPGTPSLREMSADLDAIKAKLLLGA